MKTHHALPRFLAGLLLLSGAACADQPETWSPVLEETSTVFLDTETQRVLDVVNRALEQVTTDPEAAAEELQQAVRSLENLQHFYLPLLRAREEAYNAFRYFRLGDHARVVSQLQTVESILAGMVHMEEGGPVGELEGLAEAAAHARLAVEAGQVEGGEALEALARQLNQALLKGDLILH